MGLFDRIRNKNETNEEIKEEITYETKNEDDSVQSVQDHNWNVPFHAYEGNEPYIFISYAHKDANLVYPELKRFHDWGLNIWYDQGIAPGNEWTDEIAESLHNCSLFIVFISPNSANSINVRNEINYALDENIPFLAIHLKETEIQGGLRLRISSLQAILKYTTTEDEYIWRCKKNFKMNGLLEGEDDETQQNVLSPNQSQPKTVEKNTNVKQKQNKKPASPTFKTSKHQEEFERLNTTTDSIYDLGEYDVLIVLKDGTNLTSWDDVVNKNNVLYVSEDLSDYTNLTRKYEGLKSLKAIIATGVTNMVDSMMDMFNNCESLEDIYSLSTWDTSGVTSMTGTFSGCESLVDISPLAGWDTSAVSSLWGTFVLCESLVDISPLAGWDTSAVRILWRTFAGCESLVDISPLADWNTSKVREMQQIFQGCESLVDISPLAGWNTSKVNNMSEMIADCDVVDASCLDGWNILKVENKSDIFKGCNIEKFPEWY